MTETGDGWTDSAPGSSSSLTLQQPKKNSRQLFRKSRTEVKAKNDNSWCQNVVFCGRRRQKRILSQFVDVELSKSTELQNTECNKNIDELNSVIAVFRDHLIHIAKPVDCPEIRDKIKETRKKCLDLCVATSEIIMPQIRSDVAEGIPVDSQQLVNLVCCTQLFLRELRKCHCLVKGNPMDLTPLYEKRPRSSGMSVLDRLVLFKLQPRDYHKEELQSILRDTEQIATLLREMKEFMPCESNESYKVFPVVAAARIFQHISHRERMVSSLVTLSKTTFDKIKVSSMNIFIGGTNGLEEVFASLQRTGFAIVVPALGKLKHISMSYTDP